MFGIGNVKIVLTLDKYQFAYGETVTGSVHFDIKKPVEANNVFVRLECIDKVTTRSADGSSTRRQKVYDVKVPLDGEKTYSGSFDYPLSVELPKEAPTPQMPEGKLGTVMKAASMLSGRRERLEWTVSVGLDKKGMRIDAGKSAKITVQ